MVFSIPEKFPLTGQEIDSSLKQIKKPNKRGAFYQQSYPLILKHISSLDSKESASDFILSLVTYGWMPTSLKKAEFSTYHERGKTFLGVVRENKEPAHHFLVDFDPVVNGRWVGTSKALHFAQPTVFPIWDSKIASIFGSSAEPHVQNRDSYIKYCEWMQVWTHQQRDLPGRVAQALGYETTPIRALELVLFSFASIRS